MPNNNQNAIIISNNIGLLEQLTSSLKVPNDINNYHIEYTNDVLCIYRKTKNGKAIFVALNPFDSLYTKQLTINLCKLYVLYKPQNLLFAKCKKYIKENS